MIAIKTSNDIQRFEYFLETRKMKLIRHNLQKAIPLQIVSILWGTTVMGKKGHKL